MKNISKAFRDELNNDNRNFVKSCTITLADGTVLNITQSDTWQNGFSIDEAVSSEESFDLGSAIIDEFDLTLNNIYDKFSAHDFTDAVITNVKIGLVLPNGTTEHVKCGVFTVNDTRYNGSTISLECFDNMSKFDKEYSISNLAFPATLLNIVKDACSCCNVSMASDIASFPNSGFTVATKPETDGLTFRKMLAWTAQISGIWFKCNESGQLSAKVLDVNVVDSLSNHFDGGRFRPWDSETNLDGGTFNPWNTGDVVDSGDFSNMAKYHHIFSITSPDFATDDVVVTGIKVIEKNGEELKTYMQGNEGYVLSIEDNELIKNGKGAEIASFLGNKFIGLRFRPLSVQTLSDPTIEAGDLAFVTDRHNRSYFTIITQNVLTPGKYQQIECKAETPQKNSASRYSKETMVYQEIRKNMTVKLSEFDKAMKDLEIQLSQTEGSYTTVQTLADGSKIFYLHNKPTVAESQIIWKMTAEAWGVSTDGGKTWNAGMTVDGVVIAKILNTIGVNADWINAGALTVKDESGNTIFEVDMDTNKVFINAQHVTIGSKNVSQAITDVDTKAGNAQTTATNAKNTADSAKSTAETALSTANNAQSLSIVMTNEYQGVPTDSNGNYSTFPVVTTSVQTYFGHVDVSGQCTYTINTSNGITGQWTASTRTYKVTALTADTAYVDITATYMNAFTVTKRFTVAKVKAGAQGPQGSQGPQGATGATGPQGPQGVAGRTYYLIPSTLVMKIGADSVISPRNVSFSAYYRDGTSATSTPYACRFVIQETLDGSIWTTKYTSSSDETSRVHTPSSANVVAIKCTMYAAGGTSTALDMQTVSLLIDVDNLSQEQIFNILTNNGTVQGIYLENGKVYINASYIKSGTLSGEYINAKNVKVLDNLGNQTFYIDANGNVNINAAKLLIGSKSVSNIVAESDNLLQSPIDLSSTYWDTQGTRVDGFADPDGGNKAISLKSTLGQILSTSSANMPITEAGTYELSIWMKVTSAGAGSIKLGNESKSTSFTTDWKQYRYTYVIDSVPASPHVRIGTARGRGTTYYYKPQLRRVYSQEEIFNILTNNGATQGIYIKDNLLYINANYIDTGSLAGWIVDKENQTLTSPNGVMVLDAKNEKVIINGVEMKAYGHSLIVSKGLTVDCGTDEFSDGTDGFQVLNLATVTSGNYMRVNTSGYVSQSSSSSERYKDIDRVLTEEDVENLYNIEVYLAKYKDDYLSDFDERYQKYMPMFVVENMEQYLPIAVDHNSDGTPEMWNSQIMIPVMFQMLKSQKATIDTLTERLNKLENLLSIKGVI